MKALESFLETEMGEELEHEGAIYDHPETEKVIYMHIFFPTKINWD